MAAVYEIVLNIRGNYDNKLDKAISKASKLNEMLKEIGTNSGPQVYLGGNGGGTRTPYSHREMLKRKYPYISDPIFNRAKQFKIDTRPVSNYLVNTKKLYENLNRVGKAQRIFSDNLQRYSTSISGIQRNIGNFFQVLSESANVFIETIPILKAGLNSLKAYIGITAAPAIIGGAAYFIGGRLLKSNNISTAISNRAQYESAQLSLGENFGNVYGKASEMSALYGFSRMGIVNAINVLSGLKDASGNKLGIDQATELARITGKISQTGGAPYERVSLNLMQILGQATTSTRDLRELIGQSPQVSKIAQSLMDNQGFSGNVFEFLQNRDNLLSTLRTLDKQVKTPAVAAIRGRSQLGKETMWMNISTYLEPFFKDIGDAQLEMYKMIESKVKSFMSSYDSQKWKTSLKSFIDLSGDIFDFMSSLITILGNLANFINENKEAMNTIAVALPIINTFLPKGKARAVATGAVVAGSFAVQSMADEGKSITQRNQRKRKALLDETVDETIISFLPDSLQTYKNVENVKKNMPKGFLDTLSSRFITPIKDSTANKGNFWFGGRRIDDRRETYTVNTDSIYNNIKDYFNKTTGFIPTDQNIPTDNTGAVIDDMTQNSRALIINFNNPIVEMNNNIEGANADDILAKITPRIEEATVRGLQIAIANATSMR